MLEWRVYDLIVTSGLEAKLNELQEEGFDIFKMEYVSTSEYETHTAGSGQVFYTQPTYAPVPTATNNVTRSIQGHWIVVAYKVK